MQWITGRLNKLLFELEKESAPIISTDEVTWLHILWYYESSEEKGYKINKHANESIYFNGSSKILNINISLILIWWIDDDTDL